MATRPRASTTWRSPRGCAASSSKRSASSSTPIAWSRRGAGGRQARMSEGRVATIDADGHVIEPADLWERELPPSLRARGFHIRWDAETEPEQAWVEERLA